MSGHLWKCAGRADDGKSYCFYRVAAIPGISPVILGWSIVSVDRFWGAVG